jgi:hypothetical protein
MSFDRDRFQKLLHDAGGAFADRATAERAIKDCGGDVKGTEKRVVERDSGHVVKMGECLSMVTAREELQVINETGRKNQDGMLLDEKQRNVVRNGPHEFIEYVPIGEPPAPARDRGKKKRGSDKYLGE